MFVLLFNYTINPIIKLDIPLLPLRPIYSVSSSAEVQIRYSLWGRFIMSINTFLGMVRPPWRPQIGLYEKSVSVLRAWFFEHFIHLNPKESEQIMLA
ncbi:BnaC01g36220D [Brassica napus]|uniref:BnaC01g36220D protein n=1 Tax=Brassica napus TaxID=3708 RepID=A0A078G8X3_BRANA|nr:BnaC01g36220D [Brassica napus]